MYYNIYIYIHTYMYICIKCIYIIYIYEIMKTLCPPGYHHNGFMAIHALGHMMYGLHEAIVVITLRAFCFHDCICITPILLLWDLSTLCVVNHLGPLIFTHRKIILDMVNFYRNRPYCMSLVWKLFESKSFLLVHPPPPISWNRPIFCLFTKWHIFIYQGGLNLK